MVTQCLRRPTSGVEGDESASGKIHLDGRNTYSSDADAAKKKVEMEAALDAELEQTYERNPVYGRDKLKAHAMASGSVVDVTIL